MPEPPNPLDLAPDHSERLVELWGQPGSIPSAQTAAPSRRSSLIKGHRPAWKKKRFWIFSLLGWLLAGSASFAWWSSQQVRVVVKNQGYSRTSPIEIEMAGQVHSVPSLAFDASYCLKLDHPATTSSLILRTVRSDGQPLNWQGGLVPTHGGGWIMLHLTAEGSVKLSQTDAFWDNLTGN